MLVLRLLVMVLTIICLMDGHAEVSSTTTGMRNGGESPAVKQNEPEGQSLERKKKKKTKKPNKNNKSKGKPKPSKKPSKPVSSTITSISKATTSINTGSTISKTTYITTNATTLSTTGKTDITAQKKTTAILTTSTASVSTTNLQEVGITNATTAGTGGECKTTGGKACIFPFKDGNEEYNECKDKAGRYFWCATKLYESGKYMYWSYCPEDGSCPLEVKTTTTSGGCKATNKKPCIFPFMSGQNEYNECADFQGSYFWCATGTNSAGKYTSWAKCPKDGSCPLEGQTTEPSVTTTSSEITMSSTLPNKGTTAAINVIDNKIINSIGSIMLGESRSGALELLDTMNEKLATIIDNLKGDNEEKEQVNSGTISDFEDTTTASEILKQGIDKGMSNETGKEVRDYYVGYGWAFITNTVVELGSVKRYSLNCCLDCKKKYSKTVLSEYWNTMNTCFCLTYKNILNEYLEILTVEPKTVKHPSLSSGFCDTKDSCCERIKMSSTDSQSVQFGVYKKDGEYNNNPVYKQEEGNNMIFFSEFKDFDWVVGSSFSSLIRLRSKPGEGTTCPNDANEWQYYIPGITNVWAKYSTLSVYCEDEIACSKCPQGYSKNISPKPLYLMKDSFEVSDEEQCAKVCGSSTNCIAVTTENCKCKLLTDNPSSALDPITLEYDYCLQDITKSCTAKDVNMVCPWGYTRMNKGFSSLHAIKLNPRTNGGTCLHKLETDMIENCKKKCDAETYCKSFYFTKCNSCYILNYKNPEDINMKDNIFCQKVYAEAIGTWSVEYSTGHKGVLTITSDGKATSTTGINSIIRAAEHSDYAGYLLAFSEDESFYEYYKITDDVELQVLRFDNHDNIDRQTRPWREFARRALGRAHQVPNTEVAVTAAYTVQYMMRIAAQTVDPSIPIEVYKLFSKLNTPKSQRWTGTRYHFTERIPGMEEQRKWSKTQIDHIIQREAYTRGLLDYSHSILQYKSEFIELAIEELIKRLEDIFKPLQGMTARFDEDKELTLLDKKTKQVLYKINSEEEIYAHLGHRTLVWNPGNLAVNPKQDRNLIMREDMKLTDYPLIHGLRDSKRKTLILEIDDHFLQYRIWTDVIRLYQNGIKRIKVLEKELTRINNLRLEFQDEQWRREMRGLLTSRINNIRVLETQMHIEGSNENIAWKKVEARGTALFASIENDRQFIEGLKSTAQLSEWVKAEDFLMGNPHIKVETVNQDGDWVNVYSVLEKSDIVNSVFRKYVRKELPVFDKDDPKIHTELDADKNISP